MSGNIGATCVADQKTWSPVNRANSKDFQHSSLGLAEVATDVKVLKRGCETLEECFFLFSHIVPLCKAASRDRTG